MMKCKKCNFIMQMYVDIKIEIYLHYLHYHFMPTKISYYTLKK